MTDILKWAQEAREAYEKEGKKQSWIDTIETYKELHDADLPDPEWYINKIIPNPGLIAFTGTFGSYKTWILQWMLMRLSAGLPFFEKWEGEGAWFQEPPKQPVKVLFIEEEMSRRQIRRRSVDTKLYGSGENFHWAVAGGFNLKSQQGVEELKTYIRDNEIKILALDPFTSVACMENENDNAEAAKVMDTLRKNFVDSELECSVIFIHHPAKGENNAKGIRGAGDILGKCDMHFTVEVQESWENHAIVQIDCGKTRYEPVSSFLVRLSLDEQDLGRLQWSFAGLQKKSAEEEDPVDKQFKRIMRLMKKEKISRTDIAKLIGLPYSGKKFRRLWNEAFDVDNSNS